MDTTDYCESFVEFLQRTCGDRHPVIVASGLTAGIALLMASRHPERVRWLILLLPTGLKESANGALRNVPGSEGMMGYFCDIGVLRTRVSSHLSFLELLRAVRETVLNAYAHEDMPYKANSSSVA